MGKCKGMTVWQKGVIMFGRAHGHAMSEASGFVSISQRTLQCVYKQSSNTCSNEIRRQNSDQIKILAERRQISRLVNQNQDKILKISVCNEHLESDNSQEAIAHTGI